MEISISQILEYIIIGLLGLGFTYLNSKIATVHMLVNSANTDLRNELHAANVALQAMSQTLGSERISNAAAVAAMDSASKSSPPAA